MLSLPNRDLGCRLPRPNQVLHCWPLTPDISGVKLETITDGLSVQMMHIGSYDSEPVRKASKTLSLQQLFATTLA